MPNRVISCCVTVHRIPDVQWNTWSVNVTTWEVAQPLLLSVAPGTWRFAVQMARPAIVDFHCSFLLVNCREGVKKTVQGNGPARNRFSHRFLEMAYVASRKFVTRLLRETQIHILFGQKEKSSKNIFNDSTTTTSFKTVQYIRSLKALVDSVVGKKTGRRPQKFHFLHPGIRWMLYTFL